MARSRNRCCNGNAALFSVCVVKCYCQQYKRIDCCTKKLCYGEFISPETVTRIWVFMQSVRCFCLIWNTFSVSRQIVTEVPTIKLNVNSCCGNRAYTCGQTDRQADMTNLTGAFRDHANSPSNIMYNFIRNIIKKWDEKTQDWATSPIILTPPH